MATLNADELEAHVQRLERRLERERRARLSAEEIAERGLRDLFDKQEHIALLERVTAQANLSDSVEKTFRFAVAAVRAHCAGALGSVFWRQHACGNALVFAGISDGEETPSVVRFQDASARLSFDKGVGLIGTVFESGKAIWIRDVATDPDFHRAESARAAGFHAAFAFPIMVGSEVVAVIELFHLTIQEPNQALLSVTAQIGIQLGRVVERARAAEALRHDATHDALTGLPNRRALEAKLEGVLTSGMRHTLLLIDLDRFKPVNDTFGHPVGDRLLIQVADRFRALLKGRGFLARLGGDEMAALVAGDLSEAETLTTELLNSLDGPFDLGHVTVTIGCSIGFACSGENADAMELMQRSDIALYEAKRNGRGHATGYRHGMKEAVADRHHLENDLRLAIPRGEFHLAYQPVMSLLDDQIIGYEALLRWDHPVRGPVPPNLFIPLAEQSNQIIAIGRWVLEEACREAALWNDGRHVAINVSSVQLRSPHLLTQIETALADSGLPPERLELEVTETALIESGDQAGLVLKGIRELGIRVAMDDFGTGYSSLSHLRIFAFDRIKIDRSFVNSALQDAASLAVLKGVMQIGRDLGVATLAEGVETEHQRDLLRELGCDVVQGYLIGRPERMVHPEPLPSAA